MERECPGVGIISFPQDMIRFDLFRGRMGSCRIGIPHAWTLKFYNIIDDYYYYYALQCKRTN